MEIINLERKRGLLGLAGLEVSVLSDRPVAVRPVLVQHCEQERKKRSCVCGLTDGLHFSAVEKLEC